MEILCEINLKGLNVLNNRKILTTYRSTPSTIKSNKEATTIKKSNYDHESLKYEFLFISLSKLFNTLLLLS